MGNDSGQLSVDFLLGISIFMLALGFTIQFVPGLFISSSGEDANLGYAAYRTASILTEDPGWWDNSTGSGTDWEGHISDVSRIGLASDSSVKTRLTDTPNMLNESKIKAIMQLDDDVLTTKLGLYKDVNGVQMDYGYNISLVNNGDLVLIDYEPAVFGSPLPVSQDMFKISRIVVVNTGLSASFDSSELTTVNSSSNKVLINISGPQNENVVMEIDNFSVTGVGPKFSSAKLDGSILSNPADYSAYKITPSGDCSLYSDPLNSTDTLGLVFDPDLFPDNKTYLLELNFVKIKFSKVEPSYIEYMDSAEVMYEPADLIVKVWS